ncbi:MAG: hypothetical protein ACYC9W_09410 [Candidatus Limnocylindria bacterium]
MAIVRIAPLSIAPLSDVVSVRDAMDQEDRRRPEITNGMQLRSGRAAFARPGRAPAELEASAE